MMNNLLSPAFYLLFKSTLFFGIWYPLVLIEMSLLIGFRVRGYQLHKSHRRIWRTTTCQWRPNRAPENQPRDRFENAFTPPSILVWAHFPYSTQVVDSRLVLLSPCANKTAKRYFCRPQAISILKLVSMILEKRKGQAFFGIYPLSRTALSWPPDNCSQT